MKARTKYGLIAGAAGLVVNVVVATLVGCCGPLVALPAGAVAGFLAAREEKPATKREGAKLGAVAAAIAGALVVVGQLIGAVGAGLYAQSRGVFSLLGTPGARGDVPMAGYYVGVLAVGLALGVADIAAAALGGALAGYLSVSEQPTPSPSQSA